MGDGRRETRYDVRIQGRYRTGAGVARDVPILDLSEGGARFYDRFGRLKPGTSLTLRIGTIGPVGATVRWCEKQVVGVEFDYPLYGPVFEHLRAQVESFKRDDDPQPSQGPHVF